jgi:hypothetical protein
MAALKIFACVVLLAILFGVVFLVHITHVLLRMSLMYSKARRNHVLPNAALGRDGRRGFWLLFVTRLSGLKLGPLR